MDSLENFVTVPRKFQSDAWLHKDKPVWIVEYEGTRVRGKHYQAYRAVLPVPVGRDPWTIDNHRIGSEDGFQTLEEAAEAAHE